MKHFRIKKSKKRKVPFMPEGTRLHLPKPRLPLVVFWNAHKSGNIYLGWN